ncbi:hypothetical protein M9Y10_006127 [Tritrichomonas musculus]|uniref:Protein kinase domain-containing protein n=1 Tax=Tritrichomonas musculus TaxID=1915356 RepID=A0ABR2JDL5_9EUKA
MEIVHPLLGKYKIISQIGRGSFASVYLAKHQDLKYPVAIKIFQEGKQDSNARNSFNLTKSIVHPFICQDFDFIKTPKGNDCVIMEYIEGKTLLEYANLNAPLSEKEIQTIFGQLVIAIDFLHKHQIIHRDLKCENIMIDKYKNIRLIDLSFSCNNFNKHSTLCGSPAYIAPEIINNQYYGTSVDIWSLGIIIYAITFGNLPFENQNYSLLFHLITSSNPPFPNSDRISNNLVDLIKKLLIKDPKQRISIEEIKQHPFFTRDQDGNNYVFNEQQIKSFIREPQTQIIPEGQIIKQMELSSIDSVNAVNEIKAGQLTYHSMTYNILYKNFISNVQLPHYSRCFIISLSKNSKNMERKDISLMIDMTNVKLQENLIQTQRVPSKARFQLNQEGNDLTPPSSPSSSRENFNINRPMNFETKQIGLPMFINGVVQFRRFSSNSRPIGQVGPKRSLLNFKNLTLTAQKVKMTNFNHNYGKDFSVSVDALPQLDKH